MQRTAGGNFTFNAVDLANPTGLNPNYLFQGFLGGNPIFSSGGVLNTPVATFVNFLSPSSAPIDTLRISYSLANSPGTSVINVDNINVSGTVVPEPGSLLLLGTGFTAVGARRWRNRQRR